MSRHGHWAGVLAGLLLAGAAVCTPAVPDDSDLEGLSGDARLMELGRRTFRRAGCIACHRREGVGEDLGPNLDQLAQRGDPTYVRESILEPQAVVVPGYDGIQMPLNLGDLLSEAELDALQYYLSNPVPGVSGGPP